MPNETILPTTASPKHLAEPAMPATVVQGTLTRAQSLELGRRRRGRNLAMLIGLLALCLLFYAISIVKLSGH